MRGAGRETKLLTLSHTQARATHTVACRLMDGGDPRRTAHILMSTVRKTLTVPGHGTRTHCPHGGDVTLITL